MLTNKEMKGNKMLHMDSHIWDQLHAQRRFCPVYPDSNAVRWTFKNFNEEIRKKSNIVDIGTGAGRHAVFFAREGFSTWACDFSEAGLTQLQTRAKTDNLNIHVGCYEADALKYTDNFFHAAISFGVYYYMSYERCIRAIEELKRVLTPKGKALVNMRTDMDSRVIDAKKVGKCTFLLPNYSVGAPTLAESGKEMLFLSENDVTELFSGFSVVRLDRVSITENNRQFTDDDWLIHLEK